MNDLVSSTPIAPINNTIIAPTPPPPLPNVPQQHHVLLLNEHYQIMLKKIWNIFEYSICVELDALNHVETKQSMLDEKEEKNLMLDRHLDQIIMCSIYGACKASGLSIKFQDIMKHYRLLNNCPNTIEANSLSQIYRSIRIDSANNRSDLIEFYNRVYLKKLKHYIGQLNQKVSSSQSNLTPKQHQQFVCPSPVPKLSNITHQHLQTNTQFSPCKLSHFNASVFVSPIKANHQLIMSTTNSNTNTNANNNTNQIAPKTTITTTTTTQATVEQHTPSTTPNQAIRNRICFSMSDPNPLKSIDAVNEMIRRNEMKMRSSNKRLFSDISLQNVIPISRTPPTTTTTTMINIKTMSKQPDVVSSATFNAQDENDGKSNNKIPRITNPATTTSFLNRIVTSSSSSSSSVPLTKLGSTPNTNLVTMVISNNNNNTNSSLGSNFAKKLQDIQNERVNINK